MKSPDRGWIGGLLLLYAGMGTVFSLVAIGRTGNAPVTAGEAVLLWLVGAGDLGAFIYTLVSWRRGNQFQGALAALPIFCVWAAYKFVYLHKVPWVQLIWICVCAWLIWDLRRCARTGA